MQPFSPATAKDAYMNRHDQCRADAAATRRTQLLRLALTATGLMMTAACVQVTAPTEPIEINLNINIRQEVVYRLDSDARQVIEQNAEIF
jgi:hypothetical protein